MSAWTTLELDIVDALTRRVRLMSEQQVCALWLPRFGSPEALGVALERLCVSKLLHRTVVNAHPRLSVDSPVAAWEPTQAKPSVTVIMRRIRRRWTQPATPTQVYWASRQAANLFGAFAAGCPLFVRRDHDLLLGEVFIHYRKYRPDLAQRWLGEAAVPKTDSGIMNHDALLSGDDGRPLSVIESAGNGRRKHIESFHKHCAERDLPYELW